MTHALPKLHNAMWPGLVGKGPDADEPAIDLETMLNLTAGATVHGVQFDGVDLFLYQPHVDIDLTHSELQRLSDQIGARDLVVGSVVAPVWFDGNAMGDEPQRKNFLVAVEKACRIAAQLREIGIRRYGVVRIDSACSVAEWSSAPAINQQTIAATFRAAADIAESFGERLQRRKEKSVGAECIPGDT